MTKEVSEEKTKLPSHSATTPTTSVHSTPPTSRHDSLKASTASYRTILGNSIGSIRRIASSRLHKKAQCSVSYRGPGRQTDTRLPTPRPHIQTLSTAVETSPAATATGLLRKLETIRHLTEPLGAEVHKVKVAALSPS